MKKYALLPLIIVLLAAAGTSAQTIEKYCFLKCTGYLGNKRQRLEMEWGKKGSLFSFKDPGILSRLQAVDTFRNYQDAFNYLGSLGWQLAIPPFAVEKSGITANPITIFCFRREFSREDLQ
ncbi:MAG TPA: hypothetical protein VHE54_11650 [Puia sp.]|nr:hypothetical protein [Puia sp.]